MKRTWKMLFNRNFQKIETNVATTVLSFRTHFAFECDCANSRPRSIVKKSWQQALSQTFHGTSLRHNATFYGNVSASRKNPVAGSIMQIYSKPAFRRPPIDSVDRPSFIPTDKWTFPYRVGTIIARRLGKDSHVATSFSVLICLINRPFARKEKRKKETTIRERSTNIRWTLANEKRSETSVDQPALSNRQWQTILKKSLLEKKERKPITRKRHVLRGRGKKKTNKWN